MSVDELIRALLAGDAKALARSITMVENGDARAPDLLKAVYPAGRDVPIIGITGPAGVGKSSIVDQLIAVYREQNLKVGVVAVDPSSPFSGGAILGDRIRMQRHGTDPGVFIRSMATRGKLGGIAAATYDVTDLLNASGIDRILIETVGVGQDEVDIVKIARTTVVVLMPGLGDEVQAMKAGLMEIADILVINKADREDADKLQMELESTLSFFQPGASAAAWKPKILKTMALDNTGIDALAEAIEEHGKHLESTGALHHRLMQQSRQRLIDALEYQVVTHFMREGFDRFEISQRIEEIATRKTDPYSVVQELLRHFKVD